MSGIFFPVLQSTRYRNHFPRVAFRASVLGIIDACHAASSRAAITRPVGDIAHQLGTPRVPSSSTSVARWPVLRSYKKAVRAFPAYLMPQEVQERDFLKSCAMARAYRAHAA